MFAATATPSAVAVEKEKTMGDWYEKQAQDLISRAEADKDATLEEFYRGLARARDTINERLMLAADELPREVAEEILQ
jgi:hypothetical protein